MTDFQRAIGLQSLLHLFLEKKSFSQILLERHVCALYIENYTLPDTFSLILNFKLQQNDQMYYLYKSRKLAETVIDGALFYGVVEIAEDGE